MSARRFACLLLGIWLGGELLAAWLGAAGRLAPASLASHTDAVAALPVRDAGPAAARLLEYEGARQVRRVLGDWGWAKIAVSGVLFLFLLFASRENKYSLALVLLLVLTAAMQRALLGVAFLEPGASSNPVVAKAFAMAPGGPSMARTVYWGSDLFQWALAAWLGIRLMQRRTRLPNSWEQVDVINQANYRHISG